MPTITQPTVQFNLPARLSCPPPTEDRGLQRDEVRLLVTNKAGESFHDTFYHLDKYLDPGDVLVINTSAMIPAALPIRLQNGEEARLHLSTRLGANQWLVEIRQLIGNKTERWREGKPGMVFHLPHGGSFVLDHRFYKEDHLLDLWIGDLYQPGDLDDYLNRHAAPIKYTQLNNPFPLSYYQTYFSFQAGSSEMPSAGRGFTQRLMQKLVQKGVVIAPILLHTGVSSLETNEKPYPEYMEVNPISALLINQAREEGRRVIAVGTTAIRAIETAADINGRVQAFKGNTELYIEHDHHLKVTDGLLTGFHEPNASHLNILQSVGGYDQIEKAYQIAIGSGYYWHQFGDLHLVLGN